MTEVLLENEKRMHDLIDLLRRSTSQALDDLLAVERNFNNYVSLISQLNLHYHFKTFVLS